MTIGMRTNGLQLISNVGMQCGTSVAQGTPDFHMQAEYYYLDLFVCVQFSVVFHSNNHSVKSEVLILAIL